MIGWIFRLIEANIFQISMSSYLPTSGSGIPLRISTLQPSDVTLDCITRHTRIGLISRSLNPFSAAAA